MTEEEQEPKVEAPRPKAKRRTEPRKPPAEPDKEHPDRFDHEDFYLIKLRDDGVVE